MKLTINSARLEKLVRADLIAKGLHATSVEFINKRTGVEALVTVKDDEDEDEVTAEVALLEDGIKEVKPTVTAEETAIVAGLK